MGAEAYRRLRLKAAEQRKSLSQLIREAVDVAYGAPGRRTTRREARHDPFVRIIGVCRTGVRDGALHHDRDIYGVKS